MSPQSLPFTLALLATVLAIAFVFLVRMPVPFAGFSFVVAAGMAGLTTLLLLHLVPLRMLWTDEEILLRAFQQHHQISDLGAENAILAITETHQLAEILRKDALGFQPDLRDQVDLVADRLDATAKALFYAPSDLRAMQPILSRSGLISDAVKTHSRLRARAGQQDDTVEKSRAELRRALSAINGAFDDRDRSAAEGLLLEVKVTSDVAEYLLAPRRAATT